MNIGEVFECLPVSERTLLKRFKWIGDGNGQSPDHAFTLRNDIPGQPCEYRVLISGNEIGMVKYYRGRRLSCYELVKKGE